MTRAEAARAVVAGSSLSSALTLGILLTLWYAAGAAGG